MKYSCLFVRPDTCGPLYICECCQSKMSDHSKYLVVGLMNIEVMSIGLMSRRTYEHRTCEKDPLEGRCGWSWVGGLAVQA